MSSAEPLLVTHPASLGHHAPGHPESPERIRAIEAALAADPDLIALPRLQPKPVTDELLVRVHRQAYVDAIKSQGAVADRQQAGAWLDPDTWIGPGSLCAALHSAGAGVEAVQAVLEDRHRRAFSLTRPPGHHATSDRAMGFCLFNNIAVAAQVALDNGLQKVAIIDFDVHHGNGTQDIFYQRADVLYMSCHQWPLYPGTGAASERGRGEGDGFTVNAPMPPGGGEAEYLDVFGQLFAPAIRGYRPELILVSAGFDAHADDPLANMRLTEHGYQRLAERIVTWSEELCGGRSVWFLEGGYDLGGLQRSVAVVLSTLAGLTRGRESQLESGHD